MSDKLAKLEVELKELKRQANQFEGCGPTYRMMLVDELMPKIIGSLQEAVAEIKLQKILGSPQIKLVEKFKTEKTGLLYKVMRTDTDGDNEINSWLNKEGLSWLSKDTADSFATAMNIGWTYNHLSKAEEEAEEEEPLKPLDTSHASIEKALLARQAFSIFEYMDKAWHEDRTVVAYKMRYPIDGFRRVTGGIYIDNIRRIKFYNLRRGQDNGYISQRNDKIEYFCISHDYVDPPPVRRPVAMWYIPDHNCFYIKWDKLPPRNTDVVLEYADVDDIKRKETLQYDVPDIEFEFEQAHWSYDAKSRSISIPAKMHLAVPPFLDSPWISLELTLKKAYAESGIRIIGNQIDPEGYETEGQFSIVEDRKFTWMVYRKNKHNAELHVKTQRGNSKSIFRGYSSWTFLPAEMKYGKWKYATDRRPISSA